MSENEEPDWLAELATQLFEGAERIVRDARQGKTSGGHVPPFQQRLVRAVDAAMRELVVVRQPVNHPMLFPATVVGRSSLTGVGTITATGSLALAPMGMSGQATVKDRPRGFAAFSDGEKAAFVLVWLYAIWLPWFGYRLPPELHGMLTDAVTNFALALAVSWRMLDKHK